MEQSWQIPCKEMSCAWGPSLGDAAMHRVLPKTRRSMLLLVPEKKVSLQMGYTLVTAAEKREGTKIAFFSPPPHPVLAKGKQGKCEAIPISLHLCFQS